MRVPWSPGTLNLVMYHYVRPLPDPVYPMIRARSVDSFVAQVRMLAETCDMLDEERLWATMDGRYAPSKPAVVLTFDDGYRDHLDPVLQILKDHDALGIFFVPASCIDRTGVLDVNKIQLCLAVAGDDEVCEFVARLVPSFTLDAADGDRRRFDGGAVSALKNLLQRELPLDERAPVLDQMFARFVGGDEATVARSLYLGLEEVRELVKEGMLVGGHTLTHPWLNAIPAAEIEREMDASALFLDRLGLPRDRRLFSYPYGGVDATVLDHVRAGPWAAAVTTVPGSVPADFDRLLLPRWDTNDIPAATAATRSCL